jgi:DNA-binding transcriptional MerR regulator
MFPINVVEKETGISKYLLRMWERRYTFPRPKRDQKGERLYTNLDVEKLKMVKALMEEGYRPSKIINQELSELKVLFKSFAAQPESIILITVPGMEQEVREALKNHNVKKILVVSTKEDLLKLTL